MTKDRKNRLEEISQKYGDPWIWGIYFTLIVISIIESYTASSREITSQTIFSPVIKQSMMLGLGAVFVLVLYRRDYNKPQFLYIMIPGLALFTLFSLVYVMAFGDVINGARRSMRILGFSLQPSELAKLSIVTLLSYILAKSQKNRDISNGGIIASMFAVSLYGGLMIKSGLTNTLLLMAISLSMMLIGGVKLKKLLFVLVIYGLVGGGYLMLKKHNEHIEETVRAEMVVQQGDGSDGEVKRDIEDRSELRKNRIATWLNHMDSLLYLPVTAANQQEMFSRMAQAHGGLYGCGLGNSRECSRLPLAFSDYIYSIIVEETGLVGGIFVLLLYLWLLARAAMIVRRSTRVMPSLLVIGMASFITFQALFHMAINVGLFPVSGQPLPLISVGGSSTVVMSIAFGVMLSVSRTIANYNNKNNKVDRTVVPEGLDAENPTQILPKHVWK